MVRERKAPAGSWPRASLSQTHTTTPAARKQPASNDSAADLEREAAEAAEAQLLREMLQTKYQEQCSEQLLRELQDSLK
ncbi:hypothetical protein TI39_contig465g00001 [Zymoseptoria brevis]|uniref:Uncharacterized protein n=1 Tax=Zymoseptoria brevis TaxID=1047168 RepID=A0A0F4GNG7_9PEZI|nr:hypothetical protein TI39_contig465g00001 [Zymoseptoria brevis]